MAMVLDCLVADYDSSSFGPGKWRKLAVFLQQCLQGPILDLFRRQLDKAESERNALRLKCSSSEDKLKLLQKQLESNEKHRADYLKRYEEAVSDKQKISEDYAVRISNLQAKCSTLEERCLSFSKAADLAKQQYSEWKTKYENISSEKRAEEDKFNAQIAALESRKSAAEGRLAAAREQAKSAEEEALEWKRKYDRSIDEAKRAREKSALALELANKKAQEREDVLRTELSDKLAEKEEEIRHLIAKIDHVENNSSILISKLETAETKLKSHQLETLTFKDEIRMLTEKLEFVNSKCLTHEKEVRMLEQEKNHLQEKYLSECKKFDEADKRCKDAERDAKKAIEAADIARAEAAAAQKEKSEAQKLAMERLARIEKTERQVENLERERIRLMDEAVRLRASEMDAVSKVSQLEARVDEREREIEEMLSQNNEQRSSTVQVLESLLATERAALAEANNRAEALSLQLQATQGKLDALQQELTSVRLNETALDSKLKTARGKRFRADDYVGTESVHDLNQEDEARGRKRSKSTTSPLKYNHTEDGGSVYRGEEEREQSQENIENESEDYTKFTVLKLKQELTKHGHGGYLLQLKNPLKKEIVALYEKHVLRR